MHGCQAYLDISKIKSAQKLVLNWDMLIETMLRGDPLYYQSNKKDISYTVPFSSLITLGPPLPKALRSLSMLEIHGDAFVFGGMDSGYNYNSAIYQLTCSSGICSWSTLNQELKVARAYTVAIPVPDTFCVQ